MDRRDIEAAHKAGVLDAGKAAELEAFFRAQADPGASSDNEGLRFLANFNDIFISIGLILLTIGLAMASASAFGTTLNPILIIGPVLAALWLLLEYFAGRRRLLLPSMTLSLIVTWLTMILVAFGASGVGLEDFDPEKLITSGVITIRNLGFWASAGALIASGAIYARFRLPFALFLMATAVAIGLYTLSAAEGNISRILGGSVSFAVGMVTLGVAVLFDARDPERKSLASDNGFWLHFAAAPQIMLGLRALLTGGGFAPSGTGEAVALLIALAGFAILSLALNRRALIAAALLSFWLALGVLVESAGGNELTTIVWTLVLLGGAIVLLGAGWKTARRIVLAAIPGHGTLARIFPPEPA